MSQTANAFPTYLTARLMGGMVAAISAFLLVSCGDPSGPELGALGGIVVDGTGLGIEGATLTISRSGATERSTTSGGDGSFSFTDVEVGAWSLDASPPTGYEAAPGQVLPISVQVTTGPAVDVTIELAPRPGSIEGDVLWRMAGVGDVQIVATGPSGAPMEVTESDGSFVFHALDPGVYSVEVMPPSGFEVSPMDASPATVQVGSDTSTEVDFYLRPIGAQERFAITPTALDFGQVVVGEASMTQMVSVVNLGPGPVVMSGSGGAAGVFGGSQNCQGQTLEEGEACEMLYTFGPLGTGTESVTTSGTWNGQPYSISFDGEGIETLRFAITPTAFDFGEVQVGTTSPQQSVDIRNLGPGGIVMSGAGGAAGVFGGVQNCQGKTLLAGDGCNQWYAFTPDVAGATDVGTSGNYNGQAFAFDFQGVGYQSDRFSITPTAFDFGEVPLGETSPRQAVTITNLGPGPVVMSGAGGAAGVFGGSQNCQGRTLEEGESCQQSYAFTPAAAGPVDRGTNGSYNGEGYAFSFAGRGLDATPRTERFLVSPTGFDFGEVLVGTTSAEQTVTVLNLGPGPVDMSMAGGAAGVFGGSQNCQGNTLEEGESCEIFYRFTPQSAGETTGSTSASLNGQVVSFDFLGVGIERDRFLVSPTGFDFGEVPLGTTSTEQSVTVSNLGPGPVEVSMAGGAAGVFGGSQNCQGNTLNEGESCEIFYRFTPQSAGETTGSTSATLNGQVAAFDFAGIGVERDRFLISPTGFDFGEVPVGATAPTQVVTVVNIGPGPVEVSMAGGAAGEFGGVQNCQARTLEEGESCRIHYAFAPTTTGELSEGTTGALNGQGFALEFRGVGVAVPPGR
ncbi:MAG: choice-of-anchor D domain-containing protein [Gemmatimonadetes bacterium]|nr:choice-of-anchor D domain-containing protein [Gemmatimonadota bacterium]